MSKDFLTRRAAIAGGTAILFAPAIVRAQDLADPDVQTDIPMAERPAIVGAPSAHNISAFREIDWRDHFPNLNQVTLIADTKSRALHYWAVNGSDYKIFPTSVPLTDELTKRGYTSIVRKKVGPTWTPTAQELREHPDWHFMPAGPDNPLGTRAMYLSWPAYIIHGTHDTRKIGRPSSSGCIGMFNQHVEYLFPLCPIGTQVKIL